MLIDAHQHFWRTDAAHHEWPGPDLAAIFRDYGPAELEAAAAGTGLGGCVLVQAQPNEAETAWLLGVAHDCELILGVVGWTDLKAADAPAKIHALAARPKMRGLRPMLQSLPQDDWIADRALDPALAAMVETGLSLDALVFTRHLPAVLEVANRWPQLKVVIDHGAKPPIAAGEMEPWASRMAALAARPQVFCKLSGLLTEAGSGQGEADLAPYVRKLVELFGPDRLMWGSDWPVLELRGGYGAWLDMAERLSGLAGPALDSLRGGAAARFYRL